MAEPFRVLFAIPELDAGGPDRVFYEILTGLDRARFAPILVVSKPGGRYFETLPADVQIECIGGGRYPVRRFARAVDRLQPDLVFTTLRMSPTAAAASYIQRHRPPLVSRQANAIAANFAELRKTSLVKHRFAEQVMRRLILRPDVLVAQSRDMAQELAELGRPEQEIVTIGNPVSLAEIEARCNEQRAAANPIPWGRPAIVAVGRLAAQKGFDLLLPAFAKLRTCIPDACLTIWGEGPDRPALEEQAAALGISDALRMPGRTESILSEIAAADLFVSSSRYEGFSNAILEAMALGTPVVAIDCPGGTKDLVRDGETGILVPEARVEALCVGLHRALAADRGVLATAARAHVAASFDKRRVVQRYEELFEQYVRGNFPCDRNGQSGDGAPGQWGVPT